jgi:hypothetical protein
MMRTRQACRSDIQLRLREGKDCRTTSKLANQQAELDSEQAELLHDACGGEDKSVEDLCWTADIVSSVAD